MYPGIVQQQNLANTDDQLRRLLFGQGQQGVWFDPSDLSTMFQNSEGSLVVENDGDPMKFMLDKHSKQFWPQHQQVDSLQGDPIDTGAPVSISTYPVAQSLQPGIRYLITCDIVDFQGTGDVGFRSVPGDPVLVPSRKEGDRFFAVCVEFAEVVDLEFFTRIRLNTCNIRNIKVYDVTQGNHLTVTNPGGTVATYRTDGTIHKIEQEGNTVAASPELGFVSPVYSDRANVLAALYAYSPAETWFSAMDRQTASQGYVMLGSSGNETIVVQNNYYSPLGPQRLQGATFSGTRSDLRSQYIAGPTIVGCGGLLMEHENVVGQTFKVSPQYGTTVFGGGEWYGFIIWEGNNTLPIIESVEQYLANKAGITLP